MTPTEIQEAIVICTKCEFTVVYDDSGSYYESPNDFIYPFKKFRANQLKFHSDWNWFHWAWTNVLAQVEGKVIPLLAVSILSNIKDMIWQDKTPQRAASELAKAMAILN